MTRLTPQGDPRHRPLQRGRFTFVDLCAGIGGFHLGLSRLGGRCVLASDIDASARATYARAFPGTPLYGDVWDLAADPLRMVPRHDMLAAGLPCQPFSKQGRERSIADPRGHLFFAVLAIILAHRPRYVLLENVANLASKPHRATWDLMVRSLRAAGYSTADDPIRLSPHQLPPGLGGTPQRRDRVFLAAEYVGEHVPPSQLRTAPLVRAGPTDGWNPRRWNANDILDPDDQIPNLERYRLSPTLGNIVDVWDQFVRALPRGAVPSAFPLWADYLADNPPVAPNTPSWRLPIISRNVVFYRQHRAVIDHWLATSGVRELPPSRRQFNWYASDATSLRLLVLRLHTTGLVARPATWLPTLLTKSQEPIIGWRGRRITPREAARAQGFPDDFPLPASDGDAYSQTGNAVHPGVVAYVAQHLLSETLADTSVAA